ncbi:MAG: PEP-CTERM sorting domain-containing protein [Actinobacteria bacterium]|nr:PEP-CTERM sorting domain-containing protein [Actinomycetota bacterium]
MRRRLAILTAALAAALASAGTAGATTFYLSTLGGPVVPGLPFSRGGDIVKYDDSSGAATVFFNEDIFAVPGPGPEVDAFELLTNGHMLFSTLSQGSLGTPCPSPDCFDNGDIVDYDPVSALATKIFDESNNFNGQANIDAVAMLPSGNILFSTQDNEQLTVGNIGISDGDVVEWNPVTNTFVRIYFTLSADIDAFDVTDDGRYAFSTAANASIAGLPFTDSDLVLYDPVGGTAFIWISERVFGDPNGSPLDAVAVPEPSALGLLALGLVGVAFVGRREP